MRPKTRFFFTNLSGFPRFLTRQPMIGGRERPEQAVAQKKERLHAAGPTPFRNRLY